MRSLSVALLCVLAGMVPNSVWPAEEASGDGVEAVARPGEERLLELARRWDELRAEHSDATNEEPADFSQLNDDELVARVRSEVFDFHPRFDEEVFDGFLSLAEEYPSSSVAFDALLFVYTHSHFDPETKSGKARKRALELIARDHFGSSDMSQFVRLSQFDSAKEQELMRIAMTTSPHRTVRAAACYYLARALDYRINCSKPGNPVFENLQRMRQSDRNSLPAFRYSKLVFLPILDSQLSASPDDLRVEIDLLIDQILENYANVENPRMNRFGPGNVLWRSTPDDNPPTFGDLARGLRNRLQKSYSVGKTAPEIVGKDADGNEFKLSDHRGQVVLLSFSADWCGSCLAMYPLQRELVQKWNDRRFSLLSVCDYRSAEKLRHAIDEGEMTWRCWSEGLDGPIATSWSVQGWPSYYVLDHNGVIRKMCHGFTREEIEPLIEDLLIEAELAGE